MARMIPSQPKSDAPDSERRVFSRFAEKLPDAWVVFHARRFLLPGDAQGGPEEGELDFLVLDPSRGYLGLEVKGGGVGRGHEGWFSVGRGGAEHAIKDPGAQASRAVRAIDRYLSRRPGFQERHGRISFGWGVVFPDVDVSGDLGPDLPRKIVVDRLGLLAPHAALDRLFEATGVAGPPLSDAALRAFLDALAPRFQLRVPLAQRIDAEAQALLELTAEQQEILDVLEAMPRVAIEGAAGTGKTVLALEKARRLAAAGKRTLLLCYNEPLAAALAARAQGFEAHNFHGLCHRLAQRAGLGFSVPEAPKEKQRFYEEEAPLILLQALEQLPQERFDAVICDEGQDFRAGWWPAIEELLREPRSGTLYVFFDPHQDLYGGGPPAALGVHPTRLRWNCRNTGRIAAFCAARIGTDAETRPGTPDGAAVEEIACASDREMVEAVRKLLHRLIVEEKIAPERIVVLSTHRPERSALHGQRRLGNVTLTPPEHCRGPEHVRFTSLQRFKGLEADVVILCDVEPGARTSGPTHLYVGASRARHLLAVLSRGAAPPAGGEQPRP